MRAFLLAAAALSSTGIEGQPATQKAAWSAFYDATGGDAWKSCAGTREDPCACASGGVPVCDDANTTVTNIYMYATNLLGSLPAEIGAFRDLVSVQISMNPGLTGGIPTSVANWTKLEEFYAYDSNLSGTLSVAGWTSLRILDVFGNALSGVLPPALAQMPLKLLNVDRNAFSGAMPALQFDALQQCDLLNAADERNAFSCPWPENATAYCQKYDGSEWVPLTDDDCV